MAGHRWAAYSAVAGLMAIALVCLVALGINPRPHLDERVLLDAGPVPARAAAPARQADAPAEAAGPHSPSLTNPDDEPLRARLRWRQADGAVALGGRHRTSS